jgi:D-serine deaminase-like pyridoxal phosphate-dependent protein
MLQRPPAEPGMSEDEIDTPALVIDLDAFEANLTAMARSLEGSSVTLRPHAKTHKSPVIAQLQIAHGAVGQCVQKVGEAEALAWGGVRDILVTNEVVGARKLARLAALAHIARIGVCADHPDQVAALDAAAAEAGVTLDVYVEIDVGSRRCGVVSPAEAVDLARRVADARALSFGGLQAYYGSAQHRRTIEERSAAIGAAADKARLIVEALERAGIPCPIVTGAGTGTFELERDSGVYTELQAGSYCFMDADYSRNLDAAGEPVSLFRQSLFVLGTVMSVTRAGAAVIDVGHKGVGVDSGLPAIWNRPEVAYVGASDEHGQLALAPSHNAALRLGEKIRLVPGHCDPTVDRYDWYVGVRNGRVECLWPITARGAMA